MSAQNTRFIGIRHRVKKTTKGEVRPTQIAILAADAKPQLIDLKTERDELDFVLGRLPTSWRIAEGDEDFSQFFEHHVVQRKKRGSKTDEKETIVPDAYEGLIANDTVTMILGGSGDFFAFALSRRADEIGAQVLRIPSFVLKQRRVEGRDKDEDTILLAELVRDEPELFWPVTLRDRELILVRKYLSERVDAMKARIACVQRLHQRVIGEIFCSEGGPFPEGSFDKAFEARKANDTVLKALFAEEKARKKELSEALEGLAVYRRLFEPIDGCGPAIASRIISAIIEIRRFETAAKLKAFCSVHVLHDGKFARRRKGQVSNWHPDARQALFLLGDQFNRRPDSVWGKKLREYKTKLRDKHPEVVVGEDGKKRYTNGHIHKMAMWRTLTKFVEWLFREWWRLEREATAQPVQSKKAA